MALSGTQSKPIQFPHSTRILLHPPAPKALWHQPAWAENPALPFLACKALASCLGPTPQFSHLKTGAKSQTVSARVAVRV